MHHNILQFLSSLMIFTTYERKLKMSEKLSSQHSLSEWNSKDMGCQFEKPFEANHDFIN